jgi:hypothetical protein
MLAFRAAVAPAEVQRLSRRTVSSVIARYYNSAVVIRAKAEPLLRPFKGSGRIRERGSDAWFPVEFLTYHDDRNRLRSFAYVRREDGGEILDGHYLFLDELGERSFRWRKSKGKWQFGWRYRGL